MSGSENRLRRNGSTASKESGPPRLHKTTAVRGLVIAALYCPLAHFTRTADRNYLTAPSKGGDPSPRGFGSCFTETGLYPLSRRRTYGLSRAFPAGRAVPGSDAMAAARMECARVASRSYARRPCDTTRGVPPRAVTRVCSRRRGRAWRQAAIRSPPQTSGRTAPPCTPAGGTARHAASGMRRDRCGSCLSAPLTHPSMPGFAQITVSASQRDLRWRGPGGSEDAARPRRRGRGSGCWRPCVCPHR